MKNLIQDGDTITITAAGTITSGDLVVTGALVGVAVNDAALGDLVALQTEGVFTLPKVAGAVAVGDLVYWDASQSKVTVSRVTDTGDILVGVAVDTSTSGAATATVRLCCGCVVPEATAVEIMQDTVGAMVTGNTESGITVTYQDSDGTLDFSVP